MFISGRFRVPHPTRRSPPGDAAEECAAELLAVQQDRLAQYPRTRVRSPAALISQEHRERAGQAVFVREIRLARRRTGKPTRSSTHIHAPWGANDDLPTEKG